MKKITKQQNRHISAWARQVLINAQGAEYHANAMAKYTSAPLFNANRQSLHNSINNVVAQCKYIVAFFV